ncbi:HAD family hydrolase [Prosthecobacter dejongeii]|uniref:HAD superfamily hydrolase (TIGR01490 family) n=1 Tax=Prosthecobacter dejongeii TaxID=48465 RepID=A0A7W7YHE1_9BACT|nr:HAD family hydrolase [Prosthecobacter dejongeii]MBB5036251.1 HAD superfamily hydrolase (TIGR01490 family) [Prosthecobacter dejongeii]
MRYAFFDLDHTLLPFDTQTLFCNFVLHRHPWRIVLHAWFVPYALGRAVGVVSTATAKRAFLSYLWGMKRAHLRRLARDFAHDCVDTWIYPEMRAEILRHKHQGRKLVLNTASPDFYAEEIAAVLDFDHCVATRFHIGNIVPLRPPLVGSNNKREAKIAAMKASVPGVAALTDEQRFHCWAYSDSAADIPLLEFCGNRILVHPSGGLKKHFPQHDVTVVTPRRPYWGKVGDMLSALRQMLGLHGERGPAR